MSVNRCSLPYPLRIQPLGVRQLCQVQGIEVGRRSQSNPIPYAHFQFPGTEIHTDRFPKAYKILQSNCSITSPHRPLATLIFNSLFIFSGYSRYTYLHKLHYSFKLYILLFLRLWDCSATDFVLFWWWWSLQRGPIVSLLAISLPCTLAHVQQI